MFNNNLNDITVNKMSEPPNNLETSLRELDLATNNLVVAHRIRELQEKLQATDCTCGRYLGMAKNSLFSEPVDKDPVDKNPKFDLATVDKNPEFDLATVALTCNMRRIMLGIKGFPVITDDKELKKNDGSIDEPKSDQK